MIQLCFFQLTLGIIAFRLIGVANLSFNNSMKQDILKHNDTARRDNTLRLVYFFNFSTNQNNWQFTEFSGAFLV